MSTRTDILIGVLIICVTILIWYMEYISDMIKVISQNTSHASCQVLPYWIEDTINKTYDYLLSETCKINE